jgi:hypothetical protein
MPVRVAKEQETVPKFRLYPQWNDEIKQFCGFFSNWTKHFGMYLHRKPTNASK